MSTPPPHRLRHRGPDWSGYKVYGKHAIAHERLAIIDPDSGSQPLVSPDGKGTYLCALRDPTMEGG